MNAPLFIFFIFDLLATAPAGRPVGALTSASGQAAAGLATAPAGRPVGALASASGHAAAGSATAPAGRPVGALASASGQAAAGLASGLATLNQYYQWPEFLAFYCCKICDSQFMKFCLGESCLIISMSFFLMNIATSSYIPQTETCHTSARFTSQL